MTDPARPLTNSRWEAYAQRIARGEVGVAAFKAVYPRQAEKSVQANSSALKNREVVRARIAYLRRVRIEEEGAAVGDVDLTRAGILDLMRQVTDAFSALARVCDDGHGTAQQAQQIRSLLGIHAGRVARLAPPPRMEPVTPGGLDLTAQLDRLPVCRCSDGRR